MVSDNRWVATTKGIVVFLLTALLFVFWYDRDRELAESHVTAVRFGFYRVIWIEVLCGITVAWCVRKKFRFRLPDAGVLLLGGYVLLRSVYGDGMVGYRTELWILFVILYFLLRLLSSLFRNAVTVMLWTLMGAGLVETIYGFGQLYGWFASGHSLYRLTGSFFNPGPYSGFLVMVLPVVLFYCLSVYPGRQKSVGEWRYKLESGFVWGILLLILSILPAGMSRSSWLAAVAGCGVVTAFYYRIRKQLKELGRKLGKKAWWVAGIGVVCLLLLFSGLYLMKKDSADGRPFNVENRWSGDSPKILGGDVDWVILAVHSGKRRLLILPRRKLRNKKSGWPARRNTGLMNICSWGWNWGLSGVSFSYWLSGWQSGNCSILPAPRKERCWEG